MDKLLLLTFAAYGLCHILMYGTILNAPRKWLTTRYKFFDELLKCALCTGFWCGAFMYQWHILPIVKINKISEYFCESFILPFSCYSAIVCYIGHLITEILLAKAYPSIETARRPWEEEEGIDDTNYDI